MYEDELRIAKNIAKLAGDIMLEYFDGDQQLDHKADGSVVTIADTKINSLVIEELSKHFNDGVIGEEESTTEYGLGRKWFCDPIDGTKAFVIGVPTAMFSLALVIDGKPTMGVAYDPFLDRLYWATREEGSYCNDKKLQVANKDIAGNYIMVTSNVEKTLEEASQVKKLAELKAKATSLPGAVFKSCLVALGRAVGYVEAEVNAHDMAAVEVIVEEAGGLVTGYDGKKLDYSKPFKGAVVSNSKIHTEFIDCLK